MLAPPPRSDDAVIACIITTAPSSHPSLLNPSPPQSPFHTPAETQAQEEATAPPVRDESTRLQCRFYEEQYPNPESMVMVKVMNIADMAAEVILLEYNDIEVRALFAWAWWCG